MNEDENISSDVDELMDVDNTSKRIHANYILNNVYAKTVILEGELSSVEIEATVVKNHGRQQSYFNNFRNIKKTCQQQKLTV